MFNKQDRGESGSPEMLSFDKRGKIAAFRRVDPERVQQLRTVRFPVYVEPAISLL